MGLFDALPPPFVSPPPFAHNGLRTVLAYPNPNACRYRPTPDANLPSPSPSPVLVAEVERVVEEVGGMDLGGDSPVVGEVLSEQQRHPPPPPPPPPGAATSPTKAPQPRTQSTVDAAPSFRPPPPTMFPPPPPTMAQPQTTAAAAPTPPYAPPHPDHPAPFTAGFPPPPTASTTPAFFAAPSVADLQSPSQKPVPIQPVQFSLGVPSSAASSKPPRRSPQDEKKRHAARRRSGVSSSRVGVGAGAGGQASAKERQQGGAGLGARFAFAFQQQCDGGKEDDDPMAVSRGELAAGEPGQGRASASADEGLRDPAPPALRPSSKSSDRSSALQGLRRAAGALYTAGDYPEAIGKYTECIGMHVGSSSSSSSSSVDAPGPVVGVDETLGVLYGNRAASYMMHEMYPEAGRDCEAAMGRLAGGSGLVGKLRVRAGRAWGKAGVWEKAKGWFGASIEVSERGREEEAFLLLD